MQFKRIRDLREDSDKKQAEVATYLQISTPQYQLYESGKRTIPVELLIKLSKFYNVSIDYIVGLTEETNKKNEDEITKKMILANQVIEAVKQYNK